MKTLEKEETQAPAKKAAANESRNPQGAEIDDLLRIKKTRRFENGNVPCPSCGVVVEMTINRCPFCESDIAAETALARETTRRLRELSGELDTENARRSRDEEPPARRGFFERLKYLFEGDPAPDPNALKVDPHAKRLLSNLAPGDSFKILEEDGAWVKVKTQAGDIGWVYSTIRKR